MGDCLTISLRLAGLPADAVLEVLLPRKAVDVGRGELLDWVFPVDEGGQSRIQESFNLEENPDLPEIYESFLMVVEQSRAGLCRIELTEQSPCDASVLLTPVYDALGYAAEQGYDAGEPDLLEWLQLCAAIYFLDRHEVPLPATESLDDGDGLKDVIGRILSLGLAGPSESREASEITAEGRRFIGRLLAETETYIDRYDIFKDVVWDEEVGQALFDTGHGDDLRVETFIVEAVDPVRAVFLLRLYDGTLDEYVEDWEKLVGSREFYNRILEPVVDRSVTPPDLLDEIVDQGLSLLEDARQMEAEREVNERIARRVGDVPDNLAE